MVAAVGEEGIAGHKIVQASARFGRCSATMN